ncbi:unnamed protein product [Prunus armeniaca]
MVNSSFDRQRNGGEIWCAGYIWGRWEGKDRGQISWVEAWFDGYGREDNKTPVKVTELKAWTNLLTIASTVTKSKKLKSQ